MGYCREHDQRFGGPMGECIMCVKAERDRLQSENAALVEKVERYKKEDLRLVGLVEKACDETRAAEARAETAEADLADAERRLGEVREFKPHYATIKEGWHCAGKKLVVLGPPVFALQWWTPVLDEEEGEDPTFQKTRSLDLHPRALLFPAPATNDGYKHCKICGGKMCLDEDTWLCRGCPQTPAPATPEALRELTPEEAATCPKLTDEQIREALNKGWDESGFGDPAPATGKVFGKEQVKS